MGRRIQFYSFAACGLVAALALGVSASAYANGLGENGSWQFETPTQQATNAAILDLIERKKGGYYDSFQSTTNINNTNTTNIGKQVNCSVASTAVGNSGTNGLSASTSSPSVSNTGSTTATTTGNASSNGSDPAGLTGVVLNTGSVPVAGTVSDTQTNGGTQTSGVNGSTTGVSSGAVSAGGGQSNQTLNNNQSSTAAQTASVSASPACDIASGALN